MRPRCPGTSAPGWSAAPTTGEGVEALVVELGGSTDRWDGSTYHITWSLADGREAKESNAVIAQRGWTPIADGPDVRLEADGWP